MDLRFKAGWQKKLTVRGMTVPVGKAKEPSARRRRRKGKTILWVIQPSFFEKTRKEPQGQTSRPWKDNLLPEKLKKKRSGASLGKDPSATQKKREDLVRYGASSPIGTENHQAAHCAKGDSLMLHMKETTGKNGKTASCMYFPLHS